jgi:hypothetical protein
VNLVEEINSKMRKCVGNINCFREKSVRKFNISKVEYVMNRCLISVS